MNCPFCNYTIKNSIVAETENFMAIYNIAPILPGHCIIVPKMHIERIRELNDALYQEMMNFTRQFTNDLCKVFGSNDFNWSLQEGSHAGQTVNHLHLHIIIRNHGDMDNPGDWYQHLYADGKIDSEHRKRLNNKQIEDAVTFIKSRIE